MSYFRKSKSHLQKKVNLYPKCFNKKLKQIYYLSLFFFFLALVCSEFEHAMKFVGGGSKSSSHLWEEIKYYLRALDRSVIPGLVVIFATGWTWQTFEQNLLLTCYLELDSG